MSERASITLHQAPIEWRLDEGDLHFFGLSSVMFWASPSLYNMLAPLAEELGEDLFRLIVAHSSSLGTDEDYRNMVTQLGSTFEEGFLAWGRAVSAAGWGLFELPSFDPAAGTACVRVRNPWELRMQRAGGERWGCPFLQGKVIGIFNHALGRRCWATEQIRFDDEIPVAEFHVLPSDLTIADEIDRLRRARHAARQRELLHHVDAATEELRRKGERQESLIREISAPIIEVWDGVLVVPLVGEITRERADGFIAALLERVVSGSARHVILDVTGIAALDGGVLDRISRAARSVRLVGAECALVGLSPALAQAIIDGGAALAGVRTLRSLADALRHVLGLTERRA